MKSTKGKVYLIGAGPGDPGLLTLRGASLLREAEVVIYDALVNPRILELVPRAEKILAGKKGGFKTNSISQNQINRLMLHSARRKKIIVRLKGGDPFVFGRGGEEAEFLKKHSVPFEVVPGVSAGNAVPACAGIPITDRRFASQVTFVTANEDPEKENASVDWEKIAGLSGTLVLFMGVRALSEVASALVRFGKSPKTLVSVIENGTLPTERVVEGDLASIAGKVKKAGIQSPAITVIGDVNRFRRTIRGMNQKPLQGKRILITRAKSQASVLRNELERLGAEVLEFPAIQIAPPLSWRPLDKVIQKLTPSPWPSTRGRGEVKDIPSPLRGEFDWILFTSAHGVEGFFSRLSYLKKDVRALGSLRVAAVGEVTAKALCQKGVIPDLIPKRHTAKDLFQTLKAKKLIQGKRFLLPRTNIAPEFLAKSLRNSGARVTEVVAYRTLPPSPEVRKLFRVLVNKRQPVDFMTFTSASTVHHFMSGFSRSTICNLKSKIVTIGPQTTQALKSYDLKPFREAKEHTIPGLVKALLSR